MSDISFVDAENFQGKGMSSISFKDIVLLHLRRITQLACVEWRGGYFAEHSKKSDDGVVKETVYVNDTRDIYMNAVDCLADLLFVYFDKPMKDAETDNDEKIKEMIKDMQKKNPDVATEEIRHEKVKWKRKLFRCLCSFLKRKNYFDIEDLEGVAGEE